MKLFETLNDNVKSSYLYMYLAILLRFMLCDVLFATCLHVRLRGAFCAIFVVDRGHADVKMRKKFGDNVAKTLGL